MSDTRQNKYIRDEMQAKHANYVKKKDSRPFVPFAGINNEQFESGKNWYYAGHKLEDADAKLQRDLSFINGYKSAEHQDIVDKKFYEMGIEFFEKGVNLAEIPVNYLNNEHFMNGYSEVLGKTLKKSSSRR